MMMNHLDKTMADSEQNKLRRKSALGRGLGSLIPTGVAEDSRRDYFTCALNKIDPAEGQPRKRFDPDALAELSRSIKESGLIQPLVVRERGGRYELIAGERRWRASQMAGLTEVPVVVKDVSDAVAFALALIENIQRQDLNPVEEALADRRLLDEFEFTQATLADQVGKSRSAIANAVRLLALPEHALELLSLGQLSSGHARALLGLDDPAQIVALADAIVSEQLTVRQIEQRVRHLKHPELEPAQAPAESEAPQALSELHPQEQAPQALEQEGAEVEEALALKDRDVSDSALDEDARWRDDDATRAVVGALRDALHTPVKLRDRNGRGRLEIHFDSYDRLRDVLDKLALDPSLRDLLS